MVSACGSRRIALGADKGGKRTIKWRLRTGANSKRLENKNAYLTKAPSHFKPYSKNEEGDRAKESSIHPIPSIHSESLIHPNSSILKNSTEIRTSEEPNNRKLQVGFEALPPSLGSTNGSLSEIEGPNGLRTKSEGLKRAGKREIDQVLN